MQMRPRLSALAQTPNAWLTAMLCGDESMPQSVRAKLIAGSVSVSAVGEASMLCPNQAAE